jgi:hypothetical protein
MNELFVSSDQTFVLPPKYINARRVALQISVYGTVIRNRIEMQFSTKKTSLKKRNKSILQYNIDASRVVMD